MQLIAGILLAFASFTSPQKGEGTLPIPCRTFFSTTPGLDILIQTPTGDTQFVSQSFPNFKDDDGNQSATVNPIVNGVTGMHGEQVTLTFHYSPNDNTITGFAERARIQTEEIRRRLSRPVYWM